MVDMNKYLLAVEVDNNKFEPIYWQKNYICPIEEIDEFTSKFTSEELINYLISKNLLKADFRNKNIQILYHENGKIRKISTGVLYSNNNIVEDAMNTLKILFEGENGNELIESFVKRVVDDKDFSEQTKFIINSMARYKDFHYLSAYSLNIKLNDISNMEKREIARIVNESYKPLLEQTKSRHM